MASCSRTLSSCASPHTWDFRIRACRPHRAKAKGKVERPISDVRESFFYGRHFLNDADFNAQALFCWSAPPTPACIEPPAKCLGCVSSAMRACCSSPWRYDRTGRWSWRQPPPVRARPHLRP